MTDSELFKIKLDIAHQDQERRKAEAQARAEEAKACQEVAKSRASTNIAYGAAIEKGHTTELEAIKLLKGHAPTNSSVPAAMVSTITADAQVAANTAIESFFDNMDTLQMQLKMAEENARKAEAEARAEEAKSRAAASTAIGNIRVEAQKTLAEAQKTLAEAQKTDAAIAKLMFEKMTDSELLQIKLDTAHQERLKAEDERLKAEAEARVEEAKKGQEEAKAIGNIRAEAHKAAQEWQKTLGEAQKTAQEGHKADAAIAKLMLLPERNNMDRPDFRTSNSSVPSTLVSTATTTETPCLQRMPDSEDLQAQIELAREERLKEEDKHLKRLTVQEHRLQEEAKTQQEEATSYAVVAQAIGNAPVEAHKTLGVAQKADADIFQSLICRQRKKKRPATSMTSSLPASLSSTAAPTMSVSSPFSINTTTTTTNLQIQLEIAREQRLTAEANARIEEAKARIEEAKAQQEEAISRALTNVAFANARSEAHKADADTVKSMMSRDGNPPSE